MNQPKCSSFLPAHPSKHYKEVLSNSRQTISILAYCIAYMSNFAETARVDYRLSFADQGKQTSVFLFFLYQRNGSLPFSVCSKQICRSRCFPLVTFSIYIYIYICCHFKRKQNPRQFAFIHLLFDYYANRSLFVHVLTKKHTEVISWQTN